MKITIISFKVLSFVLVFSISILPIAPTFAQLGDVSAPVEAPIVESAPVIKPTPEAVPETEGLEPEVQTTTEVSTPSSQTGPEVSVGTESGVTITDTIAPTTLIFLLA